MKLLVPSGAPDQDSCGEVLPAVRDLVVLQRLAVGDVGAGHRERRHGGQQVVGVRADGTVESHAAQRSPEGEPPSRLGTAGAGDDVRMDEFPTYPSGLRLTGRRVVVVGGGHVAQRRVPQLIAAGADVHVVSPEVTPAIEGMVGSGEVTWHERGFEDADLDEAWYVIAATDDADGQRAGLGRGGGAPDLLRALRRRHPGDRVDAGGRPARRRHRRGARPARAAALGRRCATRSSTGCARAPSSPRHQRDRTPGVVLVGGGPGDPELISVAGRKALMEADVVVADRLAPRELLGELPADVELIDVAKLPRGRSAQQEEINRVIVERALAGKGVVRFKGGDNFVFGRGYEEVLACREAGVPVTVIPGLTSPIAVPAVAGIPVTHRGVAHEFTVVSGHLPPGHPESLVNWSARRRADRHRGADDGRRERAVDRGGAGRRRPSAGHAGRRRLRRHDAGRADRARHPRHAGRRRWWSTRCGPPAIIVVGEVVAVAHPERVRRRDRGLMATVVEITDPADPRLADYRDLRDVELRKHLEAEHGLFLAEGEKVVRRAVEAGFAPRSFLMAPRWLDGLADVLGDHRRALLRAVRGAGRGGHRLPRPPRRAGVARAASAAVGRVGARRRPVGAGARGPRRPHQRRGDLPLRCRVRLRRRAARAAVRRPALPALDQGRDGRRVRAAVDPAAGLVRRAAVALAARASPRSR